MFNETAFETLEHFGEAGDSWDSSDSWDSYDSFDSSERFRRRPGRRNPPRPRQGNATVSAPAQKYATLAELEATANRLDGRIAVNTKAIEEVNGKTNALGASHNRLEANTKRGFTTTKAATDKLGRTLESVKTASMLMPLLSKPKTRDLTIPAPTLNDASKTETIKVMVDDGDSFRIILPMMLMMGDGFGGGDSSGSSSNSMMPMMLALAFAGK